MPAAATTAQPAAFGGAATQPLLPPAFLATGRLPTYGMEYAQERLQNPEFYGNLIEPMLGQLGAAGYTATPAAVQTARMNAINQLMQAGTTGVTRAETAATRAETAQAKAQPALDRQALSDASNRAYGRDLTNLNIPGMTRNEIAGVMLQPDGTANPQALNAFNAYLGAWANGTITNNKTRDAWLQSNVKPPAGADAATVNAVRQLSSILAKVK
jgi:hypothetical protein